MKPVIVIHGGAGAISRSAMSGEKELEYHQALAQVLRAGQKVLEEGGTAVDAVTAAVVELENCPLFNAGRGAVFTSDATHELDAAIMDGRTLRTGAIANVHHVRNPILAARQAIVESQPAAEVHPLDMDKKFGTVGAVALDAHGNLAAATSTGGITNKQVGRVGDAPIIGAGTYASNQTCAVSATGTGEMYIRKVAAYDIAARMRYAGQTLEAAANAVMFEELPSIGGKGGLIAVDSQGNFVMPFNTEGMYRGYAHPGQTPITEIYR